LRLDFEVELFGAWSWFSHWWVGWMNYERGS
jgi:hypothetical protein